MTYADTIRRVAGRAERDAVALHAAWTTGVLTDDQFVAAITATVVAANGRAAAVADLSLAAAITVATGRAAAPLGITVAATEPARLRQAAQTLVTDLPTTPDPVARVARLARSEPLTEAARAYSTGMAASPSVTGWTRGLSANACQLCRWWWRDGRVWPSDYRMPTHKGCTCSPIPTVTDRAPRPVQR